MKICGIKLTHDGAVALIDDGNLIFSVEIEKLNNNPRYKDITDTFLIKKIIEDNGYSLDEIDYFVVDGWGGYNKDELAIQPRLQQGTECNMLDISSNNKDYKLNVSFYEEKTSKDNILKPLKFNGLIIDDKNYEYYSFLHVTGHVMSAYSTSPFSKNGEASYILVWDGGMYPRLYYFDPKEGEMENLGPIFLLIGNIYTIFSQHFGPFKVNGKFAKDNLSVAGKVMAYIALGEPKTELFKIFDEIYEKKYLSPMGFANFFANEFKEYIKDKNYKDEDILATMHAYIEQLLINKLEKKIKRHKKECKNICLAGGCALNIKWNSAIRNKMNFDSVYVSPFPNDSGSAIGNACSLMYHLEGKSYLKWNVYSGPNIIENSPADGWIVKDCNIKELALLLNNNDEPIVFLNGRAELGPRALGNRSIIASPKSKYMKAILNKVKKREFYRPISPICLEEYSQDIFIPGTSDPYMLFDHLVRKEYLDKIPAICHLDESARLQTITKERNPIVYELISEFYKLSGIPVICNTSANYNGRGFFCDIESVTSWGETNYVWCNNKLYEKKDKVSFSEFKEDF